MAERRGADKNRAAQPMEQNCTVCHLGLNGIDTHVLSLVTGGIALVRTMIENGFGWLKVFRVPGDGDKIRTWL